MKPKGKKLADEERRLVEIEFRRIDSGEAGWVTKKEMTDFLAKKGVD